MTFPWQSFPLRLFTYANNQASWKVDHWRGFFSKLGLLKVNQP